MNPLRTLWQGFRSLWQSQAVKQEIDEELQFHLAMREQENLRAGMSPQDAARDARRRFGNFQTVREECREVCGVSFGHTVWQDIRFGLRMLRKNPGFTAVAALTLALGIGVNTTMFSTLKLFLFSHIPYPEPERLVRVSLTDRAGNTVTCQSPADFLDERAQSTAFAHFGAFAPGLSRVNFSYPGAPAEGLRALAATAAVFPALGVKPLLGRTFTAEEEEPGHDRVVILNQDFWRRRFGADPQIIGRTLRLDGENITVIGVVDLNDPLLFGGRVDVVRPLALTPWQRQQRGNDWLIVLGRLKLGVPRAQAQAELTAIGQRIAREHPEGHFHTDFRVELLAQALANTETRRVFWLLFALTGCVLLIACANLAGLQLARLAGRARELGIRAALGASRARLARQLLTESLVLSLLGGALGLVVAFGGNRFLGHQFVIEPDGSPLGLVIPFDRAVLTFTFLIALLTAVLIGTAPAWMMIRGNLNPALKEDSRTLSAGRSRHRLQNTLIVAEIALALPLLGLAGLSAFQLAKTALHGPGWQADGLMVGEITLAGPAYDSLAKQRDFLRRLEARAGALPGVGRVSLSSELPFQFGGCWRVVAEAQAEGDPESAPLLWWHHIDQSYFPTLGMPLLHGRDFTAEEVAQGAPVVIISQALAQKLWPGENPLSRRISATGPHKEWLQVVGVASDLFYGNRFQGYRPRAQLEVVTLLLRAPGSSQSLAPAVRQAVAELDPDLPVRQFQSARTLVAKVTANERTLVWLVGAFGALGLLLAAVGIYGVTSHTVAQRSGEFGIRIALGAPRRSVLWLVLRHGLRLSLVGAILGIAGDYALILIFNALVSDVFDPKIVSLAEGWLPMAGAGIVLSAVALLACWLPARRATQIAPMTALRCE